jgi:hypothetical protein
VRKRSPIHPLRKWISGIRQTPPIPHKVREVHKFFNGLEKATAHQSDSIKLSSNCGNYGGPVNPKEVDCFDASTAVRNYYGSVLRRS